MSDLWNLPDSWVWVTMGDVSDIVGGGTPPTTDSASFGGSVPWITPADLSRHTGKTILRGERSISERGLESSGARWLPKGAVLFSSRAPIGYVAIASQPLTTNQGFKSFVPGRGMTSDFVYYWLSSAKRFAEELASGTTFLEISGAKAALIPLPVAPTAEQTRIVEKLEELLSDLDAGVAELKSAQKKLAQYRQSLLKSAVDGSLTAQWRADAKVGADETANETGAQLLERILRERRARWEAKQLAKFKEQGKTPPKGWQDKYPEPVRPETADLPALPEGWVWATIDQLSLEQKYGSSAKTGAGSDGVPVIRMGNIQDGELDFRDLKYLPVDHDEFPALFLADGDLLFNRTNSPELVGKTAVYRSQVVPCSYASYLIAVRLSESFIPEFAAAYVNSGFGRQWIKSVATQQVGQANVNGTKLAALAIPLPPMDEQAEIVRLLQEQGKASFEQATNVEVSLKQCAAQRKNILKAAFSGQLVPQDPNDEPVSVLLERIRAERATRTAVKPARGRKAKEMV